MTIHDIIQCTQAIAPFETADEWDNIGLLVGDEAAAVTRVLLALDITPTVVEEAHEQGAELIISHHPVIFEPLRSLEPGCAVYLLAQYGIAALCLHTNLDRAEQGVNTALARALGLRNTVFYPDDYIIIGEPEREYTADEYAAVIKTRLQAPSVRYTEGRAGRVAVSSGGGGGGVELAAQYGFDAFVTGELKHHQYLHAVAHGIAAFDAGHFSTEHIVIQPLCDMLSDALPTVTFTVSRTETCPYRSL